jgi:hypothetical protein
MRKIIGYICMVMVSGSLVSPIMADGHPPPPEGMMPEDGMMHHPDGMGPKDGMMHGPNGMMMHEKGMPMMGERPPECDAAEAVIKEAGIDPGAFAEFTFKQFGSMDMPPPPEGMMPEDGMMHHPDGMGPKDGMMHGPDGMMPKDGMMHGPDGMMDDKLDIAVAEEFFGGDIEAAAGMFQQLDKFGVRPEDCGYFPPGPPM